MQELCGSCKENKATKVGHIEFDYESIGFKVFKNGFECDNCAKLDAIRRFEKCKKKLILGVENGKIKVNWQYYIEEQYNGNIETSLSLILSDIGVFAREAENCWEIMSDYHIPLNPQGFGCFYFVHKDDAFDFAKLKYGNTQYGWEVRHINTVVSKENILKFA